MRQFRQTLLIALCASTATGFQITQPSVASTQTATSLSATTEDAQRYAQAPQSRRQAMASLFGASSLAFLTVAASPQVASSLDMDAFMNQELEADTKNCDPKKDPKCAPKLSADEALCKYGQSGEARGEACRRIKLAGGELPSSKPQGKSLGGAYAM